jgi:hypothetical protein
LVRVLGPVLKAKVESSQVKRDKRLRIKDR